jgi:hypothetical protein
MSIYKYKPKPMTKTEFEALDILLTYNEVDEKAHWESVGKPPAGHIWNSVSKLLDYKRKCMVIEQEDDEDFTEETN